LAEHGIRPFWLPVEWNPSAPSPWTELGKAFGAKVDDVKQGWTITYPYGNLTGGEAVFLDLGLNKTANPNQMDAT